MDYSFYIKDGDEFIPIREAKRGLWALTDIDMGCKFFFIQDNLTIDNSVLAYVELENVKEKVTMKVLNYLDKTLKEGKEAPSPSKLVSIIFRFISECIADT